MRLVFLGPPGAGKGTQCRRLSEYLQVPHISTGEMLRLANRQGTDIGRAVGDDLRAGRLVPDHLIIGLTELRLADESCRDGFLLDGFPRTAFQAEALEEYLKGQGLRLNGTIELQVPQDELFNRLIRRAEREGRNDDTPDVIRGRLDEYRRRTAPLVDFYHARGLHFPVEGMGNPDKVFAQIISVIEKLGRTAQNGQAE